MGGHRTLGRVGLSTPHRSVDGGIDEIPLPGDTGRLWLAGKRAVAPDPDRALARVGATTVVCLTHEHELAHWPHYPDWLRAEAGRRALWSPIDDLGAPSFDDARVLLDRLVAMLDQGHGLLMHCGAGIGRAGTFATLVLQHRGVATDEALQVVRRHRPMAGPEVGSQRDLVDRLRREH